MADEHFERLVVDLIESLQTEMRERFDRIEKKLESVDIRFEAQAARLDRQAALLQLGGRWTNRMNTWADRMDRQQDATAKTIAELNHRIAALEGRQPS